MQQYYYGSRATLNLRSRMTIGRHDWRLPGFKSGENKTISVSDFMDGNIHVFKIRTAIK